MEESLREFLTWIKKLRAAVDPKKRISALESTDQKFLDFFVGRKRVFRVRL